MNTPKIQLSKEKNAHKSYQFIKKNRESLIKAAYKNELKKKSNHSWKSVNTRAGKEHRTKLNWTVVAFFTCFFFGDRCDWLHYSDDRTMNEGWMGSASDFCYSSMLSSEFNRIEKRKEKENKSKSNKETHYIAN